VALVALGGCGPKVASTGNSPVTQPRKATMPASAEAVSSTATNERPQSVFSRDTVGAKDPFFPSSARFQEKAGDSATGPKANNAPYDVAALLARGFQGTFVTQTDRIALVNNVMLEPGKNTEIPIGVEGKTQQVKVHCVEITRNSAVITVAGRTEPIVLNLQVKGINR